MIGVIAGEIFGSIHGHAGTKAMAEEVDRRVCRNDFCAPGFCVSELREVPDRIAFRQSMVDLGRELASIHQKRTGQRCSFLSAGCFDQQSTTKPHLDGGPEQSLLILGYEPSSIESEITIFDYARCAHDLGVTPSQFLAQYNPMYPKGQDLLKPYATRVAGFSPDRFRWVVINNSRAAYSASVPTWQGTLHAASVPEPDENRRRIVNSIMLAPSTAEINDELSQDALEEFIHRAVLRRRGYDKPHLDEGEDL